MTIKLNEDTAAVIEAVLVALDIPHPATVGDEKAWLWCLSNRNMHVVIALQAIQKSPRYAESTLGWLRDSLASYPPAYGTMSQPGAAIGADR